MQNAVRKPLETFLQAWAEGEPELLENCVLEQCFAYFSVFGHCFNRRGVQAWISKESQETIRMELHLVNHAALAQGNTAWQYGSVIGCLWDTKEEKFRHLAFGGSFANILKQSSQGWALEEIRFDLQWEDSVCEAYLDQKGILHRTPGKGDRSLAPTWWWIDDRVGYFMDRIPGTGDRQIVAECDSPWVLASDIEVVGSEEEKVQMLFAQYCFSIDFNSFASFQQIFTEDAQVKIGMLGLMNRRVATAYLKETRKSTPRSFTCGYFTKMQVNENMAKAEIRSVEAGAVSVTINSTGEKDVRYKQGRYDLQARKEEGVWKISQLIYQKEGENNENEQ